ncbi:MAG TPA: thiamine phosphate synthase [Chthonomonadaceae bacterium]|nr:thiamine phosphate synthase [Chthonomonadaceae bacterium]
MTTPALPYPCLMLVTRPMERDRLIAIVREAVSGGVNAVQLRDKSASHRDLVDTSLALQAAMSGCLLAVNGCPAAAAEVPGAHVHLGAGHEIEVARRVAGADRLIGRSVHSAQEAVLYAGSGADYLVLGTIFASRSHEGRPAAGPNLIRDSHAALCRECRAPDGSGPNQAREHAADIPLIAIGGITPDNLTQCIEAGASGVAVVSGILNAVDPGRAARAYWARLIGATQAPETAT